MGVNRKFVVAVASLAVLALVFGLVGTVAPPLAEETAPKPQQEYSSSSSSESVAHFQNPPTYDSGWIDIRDKAGQYFALRNEVSTTDAVFDVRGKQRLDVSDGPVVWTKSYGGSGYDLGYSVIQTRDGGYAVAGYTNSFGSSYNVYLVKIDSAGNKEWDNTYGGTGVDYGYSVVQTADGGYAVAGYTNSFGGSYNAYLVKTDSAGAMEWDKTYGGTSWDYAFSVIPTNDGGYALAGCTKSYGAVDWDFWLVKTDSAGNHQWNKTYGGTGVDYGRSVVQTDDSGYAMIGDTTSYGAGGNDFWLVKTDSAGNMQWNKPYGGNGNDCGYSIARTFDGGYALAGYTNSSGAGDNDFWLVKTDSAGTAQWNRTYGGVGLDIGVSMVQTIDHGFAMAGYTNSSGLGLYDFLLVKADSHGNELWSQTYGGSKYDLGCCVIQTIENGYAMAGYTNSIGASYDFWLVKKDNAIGTRWSRTYGGTEQDIAYSIVRTRDGGFIIAGETNSSGAIGGYPDALLVKTDSAGVMQWNKTYSESFDRDVATSVIQTSDGGYAFAGWAFSGGPSAFDAWLVKTDSAGNKEWSKLYDISDPEFKGFYLVQTSDGGYALAGTAWRTVPPAGGYDVWLMKTDASGNKLWDNTYGWPEIDPWEGRYDIARSMVQTSDGGYALAAWTDHLDGGFLLIKTDASGNQQWNKTGAGSVYSLVETADGGYALAGQSDAGDFMLLKTNSSGNTQWSKYYGGKNTDSARSLILTSDGGYALAGLTASYSTGYNDFWLVKADSTGNFQWSKNCGGTGDDIAYSLTQTVEGDYVMAGGTKSYGAGRDDFWLVRLNREMNQEHQRNLGGTSAISGWSQTYGGASNEYAQSLIQTSDGYILAGYTFSYTAGGADFWLVKTDTVGNMQWRRNYGGAVDDYAYSVVQTSDGGYALAGLTYSYGAAGDFWLVKTDSSGIKQWDKFYGGANFEFACSIIQTADGGFILGGSSASYGAAGDNFWLVKTDSSGAKQWDSPLGGSGTDIANSVVQTLDGGYALAGYTYSYGTAGDIWLVKTNSAGALQWSKNYGGALYDTAYSLVQTSDGGYALAGYTNSYGAGGSDVWLVKTDSSGNKQWNQTFGGASSDYGYAVIQTSDGGYALAGYTYSYGANGDLWLVKTDSGGNMQWSQTRGGANTDVAYSIIQTSDNSFASAGGTTSFGAGGADFWLVKTDFEQGLTITGITNANFMFYRGKNDVYWNYIRIRVWQEKEPSWIYGDINMDGIVDAKDLYIIGRNYGKTFSLLSLSGIIAIAGIQTVKNKRKRSKQPSYIS